ncbi:MAG: YbaB/EbfC family nucleoid-associated protein [Anaerolineaceae bacterium]|nr:YbaB/EbfC family nucleoid-associated protein [Anaerolineaceae bacterium]
MMNNLKSGGMMKQVIQMQKQLKKAQKELEKAIVTGTAGDGAILVTMTGSQKCKSVKLDGEKISEMPTEKLEKLFEYAVSDALERSKKLMAEKIGPLSGGLAGLKI